MQFCQNSQRVGSLLFATAPPPASRHIQQLGLKWRSDGEVREDFKGYLVFSESEGLLATGASKPHTDSHLEIWNTASQTLELSHETDNSSSASFVWLSDFHYLTGSNDSLIRLWNQGRCEGVMAGHSDWIRSMAVSRGQEWLLSGGMDGGVRLWDIGRLAAVDALVIGGNTAMNSVQSLAFTANQAGCVAVTREGFLHGYDLRSHQCLFPSVPST